MPLVFIAFHFEVELELGSGNMNKGFQIHGWRKSHISIRSGYLNRMMTIEVLLIIIMWY